MSTRNGGPAVPQLPTLATLTGTIERAISEFFDRQSGRDHLTFWALAEAARVPGARMDFDVWDEAFVEANVADAGLRDGLLARLRRMEQYDTILTQALNECDALAKWGRDRARAKGEQE